jgi:dynein regulatory complex protein 1
VNSLSHLDKKKAFGINSVTHIRVTADFRENQRRIAEESLRQDRLQRLQEEAVRSGKQNAAVEMRWAELLDQAMPQELHREIRQQKQACVEIIKSKDDLIRDFQQQLKSKDEEYVKALKQQADDVEDMLTKMHTEFKDLQEEYEVELEAIEAAFMAERDELLGDNKSEIDGLFEKRRAMELAYMDAKQKREEQYQRELDELVVKDAEEYNKLKIKLETDIQTLEQQLEEMRATYQLNTEKLEYNFRVLSERDTENTSTLQKQKKKLTKIKDDLSRVVLKYHEFDARDKKKNEELSEDYRRITKQYKDLQAKFRHFELADNRKFEAVWSMHEEEVNQYLERALKADQIINEQQLGWQWRTADLEVVRNPQLLSGGDGGGGGGKFTLAEMQAHQQQLSEEEEAKRVHVPADKIRSIVSLISEEAGFLLDADVKKAVDSLDNPAAASMAQAEALLKALGVDNEDDLAALSNYFFVEVEREVGAAASMTDDPDAPEALERLQKLIQPTAVIAAINQFVNDRKEEAQSKGLQAYSTAADTAGEKKKPNEEKEFWDRMSAVISPSTHDTWKHLEKALVDYNKTLVTRSRGIDNVSSLGGQNEELKALLNQYLGSRINEELIVPPTDTIKLGSD